MLHDPTFWAAVALFIFLGAMAYLGVFSKIGAALDDRAAKVRQEIEEARRLREEAQSLLADFRRKKLAAEAEAEDIVAKAKADAERMTDEATRALEDMITRRTAAAEAKIAQAETQAVNDVRAMAADVAVSAAETLLKDRLAASGDASIDASIETVKARLN
ncbi:MAG: ATP F0F1 synthase subunit B [Hyphomicrobiaceae bacterium]|nr:ATP F0F1 synthase subunit B [Hyphomicrobiaceae bacterium]